MSIESHPLHCYSGLWAHGPPWSTLSRSKLLSICNSFIANKNELFSKRTCLILSITRTSYISPEATNNQQQNKQHNQQVEKINSCDRERETNKQPWMRVIIKYSEPLCECKFIVPCRRTLEIHSVERTYNCCKYFFLCFFVRIFSVFLFLIRYNVRSSIFRVPQTARNAHWFRFLRVQYCLSACRVRSKNCIPQSIETQCVCWVEYIWFAFDFIPINPHRR